MIIFISTIIIEHISMHYKQERPEQYQARAGRNPSLCPSLSCALGVFRRELTVEGCIKTKIFRTQATENYCPVAQIQQMDAKGQPVWVQP